MSVPSGTTDGPGLLAELRRLERDAPSRPRIGRHIRMRDEVVHLGQDPHLAFPAQDISENAPDASGTPRLRAPFLGFFGPHGALPLNTTEEVLRWFERGEKSFVGFTDIFATRFLQLFFRAWSDARAITQFDHPDDRFQSYIGAVAGIGTPAFLNHDELPDTARLPLVSLFGGRVRSPVRLRQMIEVYLDADVTVEEHVPSWMAFDQGDVTRLGQQGCGLGQTTYLGARVQSVGEKIRLHIRARDLPDYRRYLPGQAGYQRLADLVFWYLGKTYEVELALSLPAAVIPQAGLGASADLGWMAALPLATPAPANSFTEAARFALDPELHAELHAA